MLIDEILDYVGNTKPVQRILLNALDEKSVRSALNNLKSNKDFIGLKNAALARQRADWLIGMNLSRAFTIIRQAAGHQDHLSIGRVKTPTMALVVRRERVIKNFVPINFYQVQVDWRYDGEVIKSFWQPSEQIELDEENRLLNQSIAANLLQKIKTIAGYSNGVLLKKDEEEKKEAQCLPYSLSNLQVAAGRSFGYEPQLVLDTMQQLYEKKLTTYPRSDCTFLPESQFEDAKQILINLSLVYEKYVSVTNLNIRSRAWNDKKISAHHAIIPTTLQVDYSKLTEIQQNLYNMVAIAYIAQFYPVHVYQATKLWIKCSDEIFTATGKTVIINGWKDLYSKKISSEDENELPQIEQGEVVKYADGKLLNKSTTPPKRFTSSTLLQAMKEVHKYVKNSELKSQLKSVSGIGTEATRAGIIDELQKKGFLTVEKKNLVPTVLAEMMVDILPDEITYPDTTAIWEEQLEQIVQGEISLTAFFEMQKKAVDKFINLAKQTKVASPQGGFKCPTCGKSLLRKKWNDQYFWGCSDYPNCKNSFTDVNGKPAIYICPECKKGFMKKRKGTKGMFWSCSRYPDCKNSCNDKKGKADFKK